MEVRKCLEYYFQKEITVEEIMKQMEKNIYELKKISKIINTKVQIKPNEYGVKMARLELIIKEKPIKDKIKIKLQKPKAEKIQKEKKLKTKIETPVRKYGAYKEGGKFKPY